jgi:hypothetical protein
MAALVSVASTFPPISVAAPSIEYRGTTLLSRPGISALHVRLVRRVSPEDFAALRRALSVPVTTYEQGRVSEIRLYPVAIDVGSGPAAGSPFFAPPEQARRILERMKAVWHVKCVSRTAWASSSQPCNYRQCSTTCHKLAFSPSAPRGPVLRFLCTTDQ